MRTAHEHYALNTPITPFVLSILPKVLGAACDLDDNWKSGNFVKRVIPTGEEISQLAVDFTGGIIASSHWLTKGEDGGWRESPLERSSLCYVYFIFFFSTRQS